MKIEPDRLYRLSEAASLIHESVKISSLRRAINDGRLVACRSMGKAILLKGQDILDYIEASRTCRDQNSRQSSGFTDQTQSMEQPQEKVSRPTHGISAGKKKATVGGYQQALDTAQRLINLGKHSKTSSKIRGCPAAQVVPIR